MPIKLAEIKIARWKTVWQFLKRLSVDLPYDPMIPAYICKNMYPQKNLYMNGHSNIIYNRQ